MTSHDGTGAPNLDASPQDEDTPRDAFYECWRLLNESEKARIALQRKVDRREWVSWPHIIVVAFIVMWGLYGIAAVLAGA